MRISSKAATAEEVRVVALPSFPFSMTASKPIYEQVFTVDMDEKVDVFSSPLRLSNRPDYRVIYINVYKHRERERGRLYFSYSPHSSCFHSGLALGRENINIFEVKGFSEMF